MYLFARKRSDYCLKRDYFTHSVPYASPVLVHSRYSIPIYAKKKERRKGGRAGERYRSKEGGKVKEGKKMRKEKEVKRKWKGRKVKGRERKKGRKKTKETKYIGQN